MNNTVIKLTSEQLNLKEEIIKNVVSLLDEGATIPFIARYRKHLTNNSTENELQEILNIYQRQQNLEERKLAIINILETKGLLTPEIENNIRSAKRLIDVEDIYQPFKEKKVTKATNAIKWGLEPLAKKILFDKQEFNIYDEAKKYINKDVKDEDFAIENAKFIIAEWVSDDPKIRKFLRNKFTHEAKIYLKLSKKYEELDPNQKYKNYYEFKNFVKYLKPFQVMALNRINKEKVASLKFEFETSEYLHTIFSFLVRNKNNSTYDTNISAIKDSLKRLLIPSLENDVWSEKFEDAQTISSTRFAHNMEQMLLQPLIKNKNILGIDPGFFHGCKIAVVLSNNDFTNEYFVIHPFPKDKKNPTDYELRKIKDAEQKILSAINKYKINLISIGNGTASRETEAFISNLIKNNNLNINYLISSEIGASVYSASKLAQKEFPDIPIEIKGAISIARRIIDPMSELIKIPPESLGVGQYQHDIKPKILKEQLDFSVDKAVNKVGVDINIASEELLKRISGITPAVAKKIIQTRLSKEFDSREEIRKSLKMSDKIFEQSIGFLRVSKSNNILDKTNIHPESYDDVLRLIKFLNLDINDLTQPEFKTKIKSINKTTISNELNIDIKVLENLVEELLNDIRDYRENFKTPELKKEILSIDNISTNLVLQGVVRNVTDFGAFIDIGVGKDAFVPISSIVKNRQDSIYDNIRVTEIVSVKVIEINKKQERILINLA